MMKKNIIKLILFLLAFNSYAEDLAQGVSGSETIDLLAPKEGEIRSSPFTYKKSNRDRYLGKVKDPDEVDIIMGTNSSNELKINDEERRKLSESGYIAPGVLENSPNYLSLNKGEFAKSYRTQSKSAFNFAYFSDSFKYQSENDIISRTIGSGYKHVKSGLLALRSDQYIYRNFLFDLFWTAGGGLSYNSGRGYFVKGTTSDTILTFWEAPVDIGIGANLCAYKWFKASAAIGPSVLLLAQNRSDFQNGEKGKNKFQFGYGEFISTQFRILFSGFNDNLSYDLFTSNQITNFSLNLEARYENYKHFQDSSLEVSGTSFGLGFTFEFL
jgi:hypothetical protein